MSNIEYKSTPIEGFEVKQADDGVNTIEGYASTFGNSDSVDDIVMKGAFVKSLTERKPKMLWQHNTDDVIGVWDEIYEDDKGLFVKGRFANTPMGNNAAELARMGALDSMSIGFSMKKGGYEYEKDGNVRYLKELNLHEISVVTFPANDQAKITSAKSEMPRTEREFEEFLRDAGYSRKQAKGITLEGFKKADSSQRDAGLEAHDSEQLSKLLNTFNHIKDLV